MQEFRKTHPDHYGSQVVLWKVRNVIQWLKWTLPKTTGEDVHGDCEQILNRYTEDAQILRKKVESL